MVLVSFVLVFFVVAALVFAGIHFRSAYAKTKKEAAPQEKPQEKEVPPPPEPEPEEVVPVEIPPLKKSLGAACVESDECDKAGGLVCRDNLCQRAVTMDDLPAADGAPLTGTVLTNINSSSSSASDIVLLRNRHKGRCLGRDPVTGKLIHSPVGADGSLVPCDVDDPNFHWSAQTDPDGNKKFQLLNTNMCLALSGTHRAGIGLLGKRVDLQPCDVTPQEFVQWRADHQGTESVEINDTTVVLPAYYALRSKVSDLDDVSQDWCLKVDNYHPSRPESRIIPSLCSRAFRRETMHLNFPKVTA